MTSDSASALRTTASAGRLASHCPASRAGAGVAWVELGGAEAQQVSLVGAVAWPCAGRFERERGIALDHADLAQQALRLRGRSAVFSDLAARCSASVEAPEAQIGFDLEGLQRDGAGLALQGLVEQVGRSLIVPRALTSSRATSHREVVSGPSCWRRPSARPRGGAASPLASAARAAAPGRRSRRARAPAALAAARASTAGRVASAARPWRQRALVTRGGLGHGAVQPARVLQPAARSSIAASSRQTSTAPRRPWSMAVRRATAASERSWSTSTRASMILAAVRPGCSLSAARRPAAPRSGRAAAGAGGPWQHGHAGVSGEASAQVSERACAPWHRRCRAGLRPAAARTSMRAASAHRRFAGP